MPENNSFDAIIIGGSYAGLSAATSLGRSLRRVLVIDSGAPCNRQTPYSHNFITHDGTPPQEISALAKAQVAKHDTVQFFSGVAAGAAEAPGGFMVETEAGEKFFARKIILATGVQDVMPDINGFAECWGISVIHCPYCHGYEYHGRPTGIMANGDRAIHIASLVSNLTDDLMVLTSGALDFSAVQTAQLEQAGIPVLPTGIVELEHRDGRLRAAVFADGSRRAFDAVYAAIPFVQHSHIPKALGCEITEQGYIGVNAFQQTSVRGVFACGDNSTMMRAVTAAIAAGNLAGAMLNKELCVEQFSLSTRPIN